MVGAIPAADLDAERRARRVASAMDRHLWDPAEGLWADLPIVGGGASLVTTPISDGVMGALVTADAERAAAALTQLERPGRFAAPFGPANGFEPIGRVGSARLYRINAAPAPARASRESASPHGTR